MALQNGQGQSSSSGIESLSNEQLMQMSGGSQQPEGKSSFSGLGSYGKGLASGGLDTAKSYTDSVANAPDGYKLAMGFMPGLGGFNGENLVNASEKISHYIPGVQKQLGDDSDPNYSLGRNVGYGISQYGPGAAGLAKAGAMGVGKGIHHLVKGDPTTISKNEAAMKASGVKNPSPISASGNKKGQAVASLMANWLPGLGSKGKYIKQNEQLKQGMQGFVDDHKPTYRHTDEGWQQSPSAGSTINKHAKNSSRYEELNPGQFTNKLNKNDIPIDQLSNEELQRLHDLQTSGNAMGWQLDKMKPGGNLYSGIGAGGMAAGAAGGLLSGAGLGTAALGGLAKGASSALNSKMAMNIAKGKTNLNIGKSNVPGLLGTMAPGSNRKKRN